MKGQNTEQTKNILQQQTIISFVSIDPEQPQPERPSKASSVAGLDGGIWKRRRDRRETLSQNEPAPRARTTQEPPGYEDG